MKRRTRRSTRVTSAARQAVAPSQDESGGTLMGGGAGGGAGAGAQASSSSASASSNPPLIDLQINGHSGIDFSSASLTVAQFEKACQAVFDSGTAAFLPTVRKEEAQLSDP